MANEFVAKNGLIVKNNSTITGSLTVTGGITGSYLSASIAVTASIAPSATSASYFGGTVNSASYALNVTTSSISVGALYGTSPLFAPTNGMGYIYPFIYSSTTLTNPGNASNLPTNSLILSPIIINRNCTGSNIGIIFAASASVTSTVKFGIYTDSGNMLPSTKLVEVSASSSSTTTAYIELSISQPLNSKNIYWLAIVGDGTARALQVPNSNNPAYNILGSAAASGIASTRNIIYYTYTSASLFSEGLPSTLPNVYASYSSTSFTSTNVVTLPILKVTY